MRKYWTIAKSKIQVEFVKRANVFAYFGGNLLDLFIQIVIWSTIYGATGMIGNYTKGEMMTYVVIGWIFMYLSTNYGYENIIKEDIYNGRLSNFLIKPINYLTYITSHSIGRIVFAFFIIVFQSIIFILIFHQELVFRLSPAGFSLFILMFLAAYLIKFYLAVIIGFFSFWVDDVNGLYFTFSVFSRFLSGSYFPIALLPALAIKSSYAFPFIYTYFLPLQFFLGKLDMNQGLLLLFGQSAWILFLFIIVKLLWKRGLVKYEGTGM